MYEDFRAKMERFPSKETLENCTDVFAYYVLGGILMNNVNLFIKWCFVNNTSLFQFSNNPTNVNKFIDLIIKEHKSSTLLRTINKLSKNKSIDTQ